MTRKQQIFVGIALLAGLVAFAFTKPPFVRWEMLWACHLATVAIALGCITAQRSLVWVGLLFHLSTGFMSYLVDSAFVSGFNVPSVLIHVAPIVVGVTMTRATRIPYRAAYAVAGFCFASVLVGRMATPPVLNVNLAFAPSPVLAPLLPTAWSNWCFGAALACVLSLLIINLLNRRRMVPVER